MLSVGDGTGGGTGRQGPRHAPIKLDGQTGGSGARCVRVKRLEAGDVLPACLGAPILARS